MVILYQTIEHAMKNRGNTTWILRGWVSNMVWYSGYGLQYSNWGLSVGHWHRNIEKKKEKLCAILHLTDVILHEFEEDECEI